MSVQPRPLTIAAIVVVLLAALTPLFAVFDGVGWFLRLATAMLAAVGVAVAVETRAPDRELPWLSVASAAGAVLWTLVVLHGSAFASGPFSGRVWSRVGNGFLDGWSELLRATEPTADLAAAQTLLGFVVWFGAASSVSVAARRRSPAGLLAAAALLAWVATAAAIGSAGRGIVAGVFVGVGSLVAIASIGRTDLDEWRGFRLAALAGSIAGAGVVAALLVTISTPLQRDPIDPRDSRDTSVRTLEVPDLLSEFAGRAATTDTALSVSRVLGDPDAPIRLRLQTFGVHDGRRFLPAAQYTDIPRLAQAPDGLIGDRYVIDIEFGDLDEPFLPTLDRVARIDVGDLGWDPDTQTAVRLDRPSSYQLTGSSIDPAGVGADEVERVEVDEAYLTLPENLPAAFRTTALSAIADATDDRAAVAAIVDLVRSLGRDPSVTSGHSLGRLEIDLAEGRAGSAEQLAALQTLLLRSAGIPARPVVGFIATTGPVPSSSLDVWVEVPYVESGWVPTESVTAVLEAPISTGDLASTTTVAGAPDVAAQAQPRELGPSADPLASDSEGISLSLIQVLTALMGLLVIALVAAVLARIHRRSSRRRADTGGTRTLGAWAEFIDRLREAGLRPGPTTTVGDVVELAAGLEPEMRPAAESLGRRVSEAIHGPVDTPLSEGDDAWADLDMIESLLRERRGRAFTVQRVMDLRMLRHRGPEAPTDRDGGRRRIYVDAPH